VAPGAGSTPQVTMSTTAEDTVIDERDIVDRLNDWRQVHLARIGSLIEDAIRAIHVLRVEKAILEQGIRAYIDGPQSLSPITITHEPEEEEDERIFRSKIHKAD